MRKFNNVAANIVAMPPVAMPPVAAGGGGSSRPPMPPKPYQYAAYKHDMERQYPMVGDVIREWRMVKNVTPATMAYTATLIAKMANIPVKLTCQDIYNYESRRCQPKIDKLTIIALTMGVTPEQLVGYNPRKIIALLNKDDFDPAA